MDAAAQACGSRGLWEPGATCARKRPQRILILQGDLRRPVLAARFGPYGLAAKATIPDLFLMVRTRCGIRT